MDNDETFASIVSSQRQCDAIQVDTCKVTTLQQLWRLKTICYKYGPNLTSFTWESCKFTKPEIVTILNFLPKLEVLSVIAWKLPTELFEEEIPMLNLQNLNKLKVTRFDKATIDFFTEFLPKNIIKDLNLQGDPEGFLSNQQSIEKLELFVDSLIIEDLINMNLSHLKLKLRRYSPDGFSIIKTVLDTQMNLIALDILGCEGCFDEDDAAFSAVCNLEKLESLSINIDELSSSAFMQHFGKLRNLKSLEIESVEHNYAPVVTIIDEMCHQEMRNLSNLKIYLNDIGVPLDRIERMGKKFPSLNCFTIRCDHPLPLDCYLSNMNMLKTLHIDYNYSKEFSKFCNSFEFKNDNLKHLTLQGFGFGSDDIYWNEMTLLNLTKVMPNLEKLELDAAFPFNTEFIIKIMEKLNKLKVIRNWSMVQMGENYNKFDQVSVFNLKNIAFALKEFSIELRLKAIDMDASRVKDDLSKEFSVAITRVGNFIVIRIEKK